ncbi:MAG TPA: hypothetical protein EYP63_05075 [Desulfotomaculum sp.]|nr:hypothetical protein [Desulfotomaculum sp.]
MKKKGSLSTALKVFLSIFFSVVVLLIIIDFFIPKDPHFRWEEYPSFYAVYGFVACVVLVLFAKYVLRPIVKRKEDYYEF